MTSTSLEAMNEAAEGNAWFQQYISGAIEGSLGLLSRAEAAAYQTLVLTVDVPEVGRRPRDLHHGFKMPLKLDPRQFLDLACHPFGSLSQLFKDAPKLANFGCWFEEFDRTSSRAGANWELPIKSVRSGKAIL